LIQAPFWQYPMTSAVQKRWQKPKATLAIILLCAVVFLLQMFAPSLELYSLLQFKQPTSIINLPNALTPVFMHFSWMHIAFNVSIFWFFGRQMEAKLGPWWLISLVIFSGLLSNIAQFHMSGPSFGGLSGVVMAHIAFVWLAQLAQPQHGFYFPAGLIFFIGISLVLGFFGVLDFIFGPIANTAHFIGFTAGVMFWPLYYLSQKLFSKTSA